MKVDPDSKIPQAEYFLDQLRKCDISAAERNYIFSAFLMSLVTVIFYLQKYYDKEDGFSGWYKKLRSEDSDLSWLHTARNEDQHRLKPAALMVHASTRLANTVQFTRVTDRVDFPRIYQNTNGKTTSVSIDRVTIPGLDDEAILHATRLLERVKSLTAQAKMRPWDHTGI